MEYYYPIVINSEDEDSSLSEGEQEEEIDPSDDCVPETPAVTVAVAKPWPIPIPTTSGCSCSIKWIKWNDSDVEEECDVGDPIEQYDNSSNRPSSSPILIDSDSDSDSSSDSDSDSGSSSYSSSSSSPPLMITQQLPPHPHSSTPSLPINQIVVEPPTKRRRYSQDEEDTPKEAAAAAPTSIAYSLFHSEQKLILSSSVYPPRLLNRHEKKTLLLRDELATSDSIIFIPSDFRDVRLILSQAFASDSQLDYVRNQSTHLFGYEETSLTLQTQYESMQQITEHISRNFSPYYSRIVLLGHFDICIHESKFKSFSLNLFKESILKTIRIEAGKRQLPLPADFHVWRSINVTTKEPNHSSSSSSSSSRSDTVSYSFGTQIRTHGFGILRYNQHLTLPFWKVSQCHIVGKILAPWFNIPIIIPESE